MCDNYGEPKFEEGNKVRVTSFCSSDYKEMHGEIVNCVWNQFDECFYYEIFFKLPQTKFISTLRFQFFPEIDLEKI